MIGIDIDADKVAAFNAGHSGVLDVPDATLGGFVQQEMLRATTDFDALADVDAVCICVPTPLRKTQDTDISCIISAVEEVVKQLRPGLLIVLESTTYPGTTDEIVLPRLEASGLKVGQDFYLAFSPERVDPGNREYLIHNTPKVIGGITPACTEKACALYTQIVETVVPVSSARSAEMVKMLENTFRAVNIGMVNELAMSCDKLGVDVWEVIEAAKTKPFGFMPFYPGPGLGGHCIPIDPLYLSWKMKAMDHNAQFIELASAVNAHMPQYVVEKIGVLLNDIERSVKGSRILILGVAYKPDVSDIRESPALDIIGLLRQMGAEVEYADPHVPMLELPDATLTAYDLPQGVQDFDISVIVTHHRAFDYQRLLQEATLIFDTRNATAGIAIPERCRVVRL